MVDEKKESPYRSLNAFKADKEEFDKLCADYGSKLGKRITATEFFKVLLATFKKSIEGDTNGS